MQPCRLLLHEGTLRWELRFTSSPAAHTCTFAHVPRAYNQRSPPPDWVCNVCTLPTGYQYNRILRLQVRAPCVGLVRGFGHCRATSAFAVRPPKQPIFPLIGPARTNCCRQGCTPACRPSPVCPHSLLPRCQRLPSASSSPLPGASLGPPRTWLQQAVVSLCNASLLPATAALQRSRCAELLRSSRRITAFDVRRTP
jgi:hypothetical protein